MPPLNSPGDLYSSLTASPLSRPMQRPSPNSVNLPACDLISPCATIFFVDVERGLAKRLAIFACLVANELYAKRILARLKLIRRDELLFRLDAEEVADVVEFLVLDEQSITAETPWAKITPEQFASVISTSARIMYERPRTLTATPSGTGDVPG